MKGSASLRAVSALPRLRRGGLCMCRGGWTAALRRAAALAAFGVATAAPHAACANPPAPQTAAPARPATPARPIAMKFDAARAWADLQRQVGFGPRPGHGGPREHPPV